MKNRVLNLDVSACFVCGARFKTSVPAGYANKEEHHVFPRNAGGLDGPLIFLCDSHHSDIHKIAERLKRKATFSELLETDKIKNSRLLWLASMIVKAERSSEGDPNKMLVNSVKLSQQDVEMLKRLQSIYPKLGRNEILRAALRIFYTQHFR